MPQKFERVISADSHVNEPVDLWWKAMGAKFGDRTPRLLDEFNGTKGRFFFNGRKVISTTVSERELEKTGMPLNVANDPAVRVKFQEEADIEAEVFFPSSGLGMLTAPDREAMRAAIGVYNDWMIEFRSHDPKRLVGVALIPTDDVDWAVKELRRTARAGLWGACINAHPMADLPPYRDTTYDPLWEAAQEIGAPLTLHLATGIAPTALSFQNDRERQEAPSRHISGRTEIMHVLGNDFIFGRILDRFPRLTLICSEYEISWLPWFASKMDELHDEYAYFLRLPKLEMRPSEYVWKRMWHGMINDPFGAHTIQRVGGDRILWGSDFPHVRSIGLDAHATLGKFLEGVPMQVQNQVVGGNIAALLGM